MSTEPPIIVPGASSPIGTEARQTLRQFAEIAHEQLERELARNGLQGQVACAIVLWHRVDPSVTYATHKWLTREFAQAVHVLHAEFQRPVIGG